MTRARPLVLVLTPDFPPARGGIQALAYQVVNEFTRVDVQVVAIDAPGASEFDERQQFPVRRVGGDWGSRAAAVMALNVWGFLAAARRRPDAILSLHIVAGPAAALARKRLSIPFAQYVYAKEIGARPALASHAMGRADRVIAISNYARTLAMSVGAQASRIALIHPGVSLPSRVERVAMDRPIILSIARLEDRYKGHDVLMRTMPIIRASVPDVEWVILGDGPLRPALEGLATAVGVDDCVSFLGSVSDGERDHWLARGDVLVMASRMPAQGLAGEGFGIVYLEANAYGMPAVGGNVGGATDAIVDGQTGLLVDPTDPIDLAGAIVRLITDGALARRLGEQGMARAQEFAWPRISAQVEEVLLDLVEKRASAARR